MVNRKKLFFGVVIVPMVVAIIYYAFFAIDRYVSSAQITVRQANSEIGQQAAGLAIMLAGVNPTSREETLYLREYIVSGDMLEVLKDQLPWVEHYSNQWRDPLYWIADTATQEEQLKFYQRVVTTHYDEQTGLLLVDVQAYSSEFAEQVLKLILSTSERFVNELSHRMAREQMTFAQTELANARRNYEEQRERLIQFQSQNQFLDAERAATDRATVIGELEAELVRERAELRGLRSTLADQSPAVRAKRNRINALEQQLKAESQRLLSPPGGDQLNVIAARYRNLTIDVGIAEEAYKLSVAAVENARIEASKKIRSLVTVVSPNQPDEAIYPRVLYNLITLFIGLMLLYGIARFIIANIEDHRD